MSVLDPGHLLEQAERLIQPPPAGPPRQVDLRRAVSAAYYALFHAAATALADEYVRKAHRNTTEYHLAYRSLNHRWLKQLCEEIVKRSPARKFQLHFPTVGFDQSLKVFADAVPKLQEARHRADYDPSSRLTTANARAIIGQGRYALESLQLADQASRKRFLALLAFPPRSAGE